MEEEFPPAPSPKWGGALSHETTPAEGYLVTEIIEEPDERDAAPVDEVTPLEVPPVESSPSIFGGIEEEGAEEPSAAAAESESQGAEPRELMSEAAPAASASGGPHAAKPTIPDELIEKIGWEVVPKVAEALLREQVESVGRELIEKIAWEVVPQLAEAIIREELDRLVRERKIAGL